MRLNIITLAILILGLALLIQRSIGLQWTPIRIAGAAIAIPSLALLVLARIQLGRAFSIQAKASSLVTTGLYARIRDPIYFFGTLGISGVFLWIDRPWFLLALVILIPVQIIRSREEGKVLSEKFRAQYLEYKRRTWF